MLKKILIILLLILNYPCLAQDYDVLHVTPEKTYVLFFDKKINNAIITPNDIAELWLTTDIFDTKSEITLQIKKEGLAEIEIISDENNSYFKIISDSDIPDTISERFIDLDIAEDIKK